MALESNTNTTVEVPLEEKVAAKSPPDPFFKSEYGSSKVTIQIDSDTFDLARCLCFVVGDSASEVSPQDLLENVLRVGMVEACSPYVRELKATFKRNPYDRMAKYVYKDS